MHQPVLRNQKEDMSVEVTKEIIFSWCQSEDPRYFSEGNEKGGGIRNELWE